MTLFKPIVDLLLLGAEIDGEIEMLQLHKFDMTKFWLKRKYMSNYVD